MEQGISILFQTLPTGPVTGLLVASAVASYFLGCFNGAVLDRLCVE